MKPIHRKEMQLCRGARPADGSIVIAIPLDKKKPDAWELFLFVADFSFIPLNTFMFILADHGIFIQFIVINNGFLFNISFVPTF